jgi:glycosyltransferase involved in cell wall biosynthesis
MIRVLQLSDSIEKRNGRMSVIMNVYRRIDRTKIQFDFLVTDFGHENYSEEIRKLGGRIYSLPYRRQTIKNIKALFFEVTSSNEYLYIHYHAISKWGICLNYARKLGLKVIVHSHATQLSDNFVKSIRNRLFSLNVLYCSDKRVAVSPEAGDKLFLWKDYKYIPNMIDHSKFLYDKRKRDYIRHKYNIGNNDKLIGMIGRISKQKNQIFALKVFKKLKAKYPNVKLMIVGDYNEKEKNYYKKVKDYINKNCLNDSVILTGFDNGDKYYSAFDLFWLTSLYEGMPTVGIEAEANGLPMLVSYNVTKSMKIIDNVKFLPIDKTSLWVKSTEQLITKSRESNISHIFKNSSFDENHVMNSWINLYI